MSDPFSPWRDYSNIAPTANANYNISDPNFNLPYLPTTLDDTDPNANFVFPSVYNTEVLSDFLTVLRIELNDRIIVGKTPKFDDVELTGYLNDGIKDYSNFFRFERSLQITATSGQEEYQLPSDVKEITSVRYIDPIGNVAWLKDKPFKAGNSYNKPNVGYSKLGIWANRFSSTFYVGHYDFRSVDNQRILWLDYAPQQGGIIQVDYKGTHLLFTKPNLSLSASDPYNIAAYSSYTTINNDHNEALTLYAKAKAFLRVEGQDANLSRWKEQGTRTDNPIKLESTRFFLAYNSKIKAYKGANVRIGRLYRR